MTGRFTDVDYRCPAETATDCDGSRQLARASKQGSIGAGVVGEDSDDNHFNQNPKTHNCKKFWKRCDRDTINKCRSKLTQMTVG